MNNGLLEKLGSLGLSLPQISTPGGNYVSVNIRGSLAFIAIQFPIWNDEFRYQGILGDTISSEDGYLAAQLCALNVLAQAEAKIGFGKIEGLNHLDIYYVGNKLWDEAPKVANGASDLLVNVLGEKGQHSRSLVGAGHLPRNFCVGVVSSFTIKE